MGWELYQPRTSPNASPKIKLTPAQGGGDSLLLSLHLKSEDHTSDPELNPRAVLRRRLQVELNQRLAADETLARCDALTTLRNIGAQIADAERRRDLIAVEVQEIQAARARAVVEKREGFARVCIDLDGKVSALTAPAVACDEEIEFLHREQRDATVKVREAVASAIPAFEGELRDVLRAEADEAEAALAALIAGVVSTAVDAMLVASEGGDPLSLKMMIDGVRGTVVEQAVQRLLAAPEPALAVTE